MKYLIIIAMMLLSPFNLFAIDKWTTEDIILQGISTSLLLIDWKQTNWIVDNPVEKRYINERTYIIVYHKEKNPILGAYPSKAKIALYFSSCILLNTGIAIILPKPYRNIFQISIASIEIYATTNNFNAGVKLNF